MIQSFIGRLQERNIHTMKVKIDIWPPVPLRSPIGLEICDCLESVTMIIGKRVTTSFGSNLVVYIYTLLKEYEYTTS
jgi:hypothetical protein